MSAQRRYQRGLVEEALVVTREAAVDDITDEIRVARLIAHMRPYLISATTAALRIPQQRPHEQRTPGQRRIGMTVQAVAEQARIRAARRARERGAR